METSNLWSTCHGESSRGLLSYRLGTKNHGHVVIIWSWIVVLLAVGCAQSKGVMWWEGVLLDMILLSMIIPFKTNHGKYIVKPRNHEHQKYLWNVTASQGESPLGVRNFTLQWWLDCGFQVSSYVCNVIVIGQYTIGLSKLLSEFHCACNTTQFQNSRTLGSGNQEMLSIQPKWNGT